MAARTEVLHGEVGRRRPARVLARGEVECHEESRSYANPAARTTGRRYTGRVSGRTILAITAATVRSQRAPANWNDSRAATPIRAVMWFRSRIRARWRRVFTVSSLMSRQAAVSAVLRPS